MSHSIVALSPARAGSVRVRGKNMRLLGGKPLLQWTIDAALETGLFSDIYVSTEDQETGAFAESQRCVWIPRPVQYATAESPDIEWVTHAIDWMAARDIRPDILTILRPTSPFRGAATITEMMTRFLGLALHPKELRVDSMRAIRKATEHPMKAWIFNPGSNEMTPFVPGPSSEGGYVTAPAHSRPTQTLPLAYVQTAGMEIVWREVVETTNTISGSRIFGYLLEGPAALDINTPDDWDEAERIVATRGLAERKAGRTKKGK